MTYCSESNKRFLKLTTEASDEVRKRAERAIEKEIDPIYKELAAIYEWGIRFKYLPWLLEKAMTVEQAKIMRTLPDPDHEESAGRLEVSEKFAQKLGLDKKTIEADIQDLYQKGWVFPTRKGPQGPRSLGQWIDTQNNPKFDKPLGREYFDLLRLIAEEELPKTQEDKIVGGEGLGLRIIPRWKAIKDIPGVLPVEDIRELVNAKQLFGVLECACRKRYPKRECGVPEALCLVMDATARYNIDRGAARELTRKEFLNLIDETAKYPTVHVGQGAKDPQSLFGLICNCHWCCCEALRPAFLTDAKYKPEAVYRKSRFQAIVDPAKCIGCKTCVEKRCQFGAAQVKYYPEYGGERAYIDAELCMGCGNCVETCPVGARSMKVVRPPEYVLRDAAKRGY